MIFILFRIYFLGLTRLFNQMASLADTNAGKILFVTDVIYVLRWRDYLPRQFDENFASFEYIAKLKC